MKITDMFEYHGWATLRTDIVDEYGDEDREELQTLLTHLRQYIETLPTHGSIHIEVCNGLYALNIFGCNNHRNESIVNLFKWLAEKACSSYGLLYIYDDEDFKRGSNYTNHFRVWKLALGQLVELDDPFLSPYIPTVELPFGEDV